MANDLREIVRDTIERHRMLSRGERVLVALSGGPDSVCLLNVLEELQPAYSLTLSVAHFNHMLRGEAADQDAAFSERLASKKGMAFVGGSSDVDAFAKANGLSVEEAGRRLRYEFLWRSAQSLGAGRIATGHTADDQAETILMRLIRGAGPHGLSGIPPVRPVGNSRGPDVIRPLINVWRADVMRYVRSRKLKYQKDASNESQDYFRNRIRLDLIPHLQEKYNAQIKQRLSSAASALAIENDFMEYEAELLAGEVTTESKPGWVVFEVGLLASFHVALRKRIFRKLVMLTKPDAPMLESSHYDDADTLIRSSGGRLDLPGGLCLEISEGAGLLSTVARQRTSPVSPCAIPITGRTVISSLNLEVTTRILGKISSPSRLISLCTSNRQYFDLDAVRPPLEIRSRRPGDAISPLGIRGSKKLKDLFIDKRVPRFLRDNVPLLVSNSRIIWVMGHAIDKKYRLKDSSTAALRVDYEQRST